MACIKITSQKCVTPLFFTVKRKICTAGIIVIGDEILKGQIQDTNSRYLAAEIRTMGVHLKKISVIGDVIQDVSEEVRLFATKYNHVITTGGIGPTHDDITYEAVARAFNQPLVLNETLKELILKYYETNDFNISGMKMAYIPQQAKLYFKKNASSEPLVYPTISVSNVYMFPGIPEFLVKNFSHLKEVLFKTDERFFTKFLYVRVLESQIVGILDEVVRQHPRVQIGSYPKVNNKQYKVKLTIESSCEEETNQAYDKLVQLLPKTHIVNNDEVEEK